MSVVQEALSNVSAALWRHESRHQRALLACDRTWWQAEVCDNGRGLDVEQLAHCSGTGIAGMQQRARLAGGNWCCSSQPGEGTRVLGRSVPGVSLWSEGRGRRLHGRFSLRGGTDLHRLRIAPVGPFPKATAKAQGHGTWSLLVSVRGPVAEASGAVAEQRWRWQPLAFDAVGVFARRAGHSVLDRAARQGGGVHPGPHDLVLVGGGCRATGVIRQVDSS